MVGCVKELFIRILYSTCRGNEPFSTFVNTMPRIRLNTVKIDKTKCGCYGSTVTDTSEG